MNTMHLLEQIQALWPDKLNDEQTKALSDATARLDINPEQVTAVCRSIWGESASKTPLQVRLIEKLKDAASPLRHAKQAAATEPERLRVMRGHLSNWDGPALQIVCNWYRDAAERSMRLRGFVRESWLTNAVAELQSVGCVTLSQAEAWAGRVYAEYPHKAPAKADRTELQIKFAAMESGTVADLAARAAGGGE